MIFVIVVIVVMDLVCSAHQVIDVQSERDGVGGWRSGVRGSHDQSKKVRVRTVTLEPRLPGKSKALIQDGVSGRVVGCHRGN